MQYRRPTFLTLLSLAGVGMMATNPVWSDTPDSGILFKGPMSPCVVKAEVVYPCVSLTPPGYQPHPGTNIASAARGLNLPLAGDTQDRHWLAKLKNGEIFATQWRLARQLRGMTMDFSLDRSGAAMNMDMGPMKLNFLAEDGRFSDSSVFLSIERSW